jgi:hypothetical protein
MEAVVSWLDKSCPTHLDKAVGKPQHVHDGNNALVEVEAVISCLHDSWQSLQPLLQFPKEKSIFVHVKKLQYKKNAVLRIRIHMFLALQDPDLDPLVQGTDPDSSIIKQKK